MRGIKKLLIVVSIGASLLMPATKTHAGTSFDSLSFKPATDQGYYLTVEQSQTLKQWGYALGVLTEFTNDSVVAFTPTHTLIQKIVRNEIATEIGGAVGLLDWLNAGLLVSVVPYQQFNTFPTNASDNGARMGDIRFNLKARVLDNEKYPVGIAVVPFVTFPTGSDSHFVGNGQVTGGGVVVFDSKRIADRFSASLNLGTQIRSTKPLAAGNGVANQFLYGAGLNYAVAKPVQLIAEVNGWTTYKNFFKDNNRNMEVNGGVRFLPTASRRLALTVGGGTGLLDAIGAPDYRVFASLAYRHPKEEEAPAPPPPLKMEVIRTNKIHFEFNKAVIKPSSYPILDNIVSILKNRDDVESVRVEGHTDSKGSDEYNMKLSDRRAAAVMEYLIGHGVPRSKLTSVGKGESEPIAPNQINGKDNPAGRAENRRVEFHLTVRPGSHLKIIKEQEAPTYPEGSTPSEEKPVKNRKKVR